MTTSVTLTGTGVPHPSPGRAGPGALVRHGDVMLQFDAGRGTVLRLADAGVEPYQLTALFVTHVHSDHLVDLADVAMTRWLQKQVHVTGPLTIYAVQGHAATFVEHMFDVYVDDIATRTAHVQANPPEVELHVIDTPHVPTEVWRSADGGVRVEAVAVRHEPVVDAVAYRVITPDGVIVISGDTRVCDEVEAFAHGADILVHEACRATALRDAIAGTVFETILSYHADTVPLGALAQRAGVGHLVLTHLIPAPLTPHEEAGYERDVRAGGYTGRLTVGRDLMTFDLGGAPA